MDWRPLESGLPIHFLLEVVLMGLLVLKFGGSSVRDAEHLLRMARIVREKRAAGHDVAVVLSAQGDTTDALLEKARELSSRPSPRELDMLLSAGEQMSAALGAMALHKLGVDAVSLCAWQLPLRTDGVHTNAEIEEVGVLRLKRELDAHRVAVVAGFQGIDEMGDVTTLGRGGSDTSAVAIAASMHADICQIYTDVDGVYTADPRKVEGAKKMSEISYDEMLELATLGAQVLNNRSVEMAKKYNVELEVLSSLEDKPGTKVKEAVKMEKMLVKGVACDKDILVISIIGLNDTPGIAFKVFNQLSRKNVNVDIILQSVGRDGTKDITFTVPKTQKDDALAAIEMIRPLLEFSDVVVNENSAKISIVGAGMETHPGVASKMFEALSDAGINIHMISTSEIKISVLIDAKDASKAIQVVHDAFID